MSQAQKLLEQRARFQAEYEAGNINQANYNTAMAYNQQQLKAVGYTVSATTTHDPATPLKKQISQFTATPEQPTARISPMPNAPTSPIIQDSMGVWVRSDYDVVQASKESITVAPKGRPSLALENAKQQAETLSRFGLGANTRQGTSPSGPSIAQITGKLSPEDKAEFEAYQQGKVTQSMLNLGEFLVAGVVAPVIGPATAVKAAGVGLGLTQAVKTGSYALGGQNITGSLLTTQEAFEAGTTGVIFTGAFGAGAKAYKVVAPKVNVLAESALSRSTRIFESALNRIEPGLGKATTLVAKSQATKIGKALDAKEAKLSTPIKYSGKVNKAADLVVGFKNEVVTIGQRAADVIPDIGSGNVAVMFIRDVARPNLWSYSKVAKTSTVYRDTEFRINAAKGEYRIFKNDFQDAAKPLVKTGKALSVGVKNSRVFREYLYDKAVRTPNTVLKAPSTKITPRKTKLYTGDDIFYGENVKPIKARSSLSAKAKKSQTARDFKTSFIEPVTDTDAAKTAKFIGKVAAGKARSKLNIKAPKDVLLKSERTPLKFSAPKEVAKDFKPTTTGANKATQAFVSQAESKVTSGSAFNKVMPYPGVRANVREVEETEYLTYPNKQLGLSKQSLKVYSSVTQLPRQKVSNPLVNQVSIKNNLNTDFAITSRPNQTFRVTPSVIPINRITEDVITKPITKPIFNITSFQGQKQNIKLGKPFAPFQTGGGSGFGVGVNPLTGKWAKRNTRIKTFDEMFRTFGVKVPKQTVKNVNKLDNAILKANTKRRSGRKSKR